MRLPILFSTVLLAIVGCANTALEPRNVTSASLKENQGVLIGSFARDPSGPNYFSQRFFFKNTSTGEVHELRAQPTFNVFNGKTPDDFTEATSNGAVFALTLPAGRYTFFNFRLYQSNGYFQQSFTSKSDYSIPFEIYPAKVNYIGEIKIMTTVGKNFFGRPVHAGGLWFISNQRDRDIRLLNSLHPDVPTMDVVSVIPDRKDIFTPLVVLPSELTQ